MDGQNKILYMPDNEVTIEEFLTQLQVPLPRKALNGTAKASRIAFASQIREYREKNRGKDPLYNELVKLIDNPLLIDFIMFCQAYPVLADYFLKNKFENFLKVIERKAAVTGG